MSESNARKAGNPFDVDVRDTQRLKGLSSPEEWEAVATDIYALRRDGYLILEGLLSTDKVVEIGAAMDTIHATTPLGITDFEGFRTRRIYNFMKKTRTADELCTHPRVIAIIEGCLRSQIQLSSATGITLLPGETAQGLHRDDSVYPLPRPRPPLMVGTLWAIDAYTPQPSPAPSCCPAVTFPRRNRSRRYRRSILSCRPDQYCSLTVGCGMEVVPIPATSNAAPCRYPTAAPGCASRRTPISRFRWRPCGP